MQTEHLSDEQIESLSRQPDTLSSLSQGSVSHFQNCDQCRGRMEKFKEFEAKLRRLSRLNTGTESPDCPDEKIWLDVAARILPDAETLKHLEHAATCGNCGPQIKRAMAIYDEPTTEEEQRIIDSLPRPKLLPEYKSKNANTASAIRLKTGFFPGFRPFAAGLALAAVVAVAIFVYRSRLDAAGDAERLLAEASTADRPFEMQIPFEGYSEYRGQRDESAHSRFDNSEPYHKATQQILGALKTQPGDPKWLLLQARSQLLVWQYKQALETLSKISADQAGSRDFLLTKALALFEKAEMEKNDDSYGQSYTVLSDLLQKNPDDAIARFNRAIVSDKRQMGESAEADWNQYLKLESNPAWAKEAQERLQKTKEKKTRGQ